MLDPEVRFTNFNPLPVTRQWDFGDGSSSNENAPMHAYAATGKYPVFLTVTSSEGCKDFYSGMLKVKDLFLFYVPSAFTPNGDGLNDSFEVFFNDSLPFTLEIFSRWGELIYRGDEKHPSWNGKKQRDGQVVQDGVYAYKLTYQRKSDDSPGPLVVLHGSLTVVKDE